VQEKGAGFEKIKMQLLVKRKGSVLLIVNLGIY